MRNILGARFIFSAAIVGSIGVWAACGGSDDQDVVDTDAGADTGSPDTSSNNSDTGSNNDKDSSSSSDATQDTQPIYDAGPPVVLDSGEDGGTPCVLGGLAEQESNDDKTLANEMNPTRCGFVKGDGGDGGGPESDWMTFTLSDASSTFYVQYAGNVKVFVETDGQAPVDITTGSPALKFFYNQPYYAEIRSADGKTQNWRLTLFQQ